MLFLVTFVYFCCNFIYFPCLFSFTGIFCVSCNEIVLHEQIENEIGLLTVGALYAHVFTLSTCLLIISVKFEALANGATVHHLILTGCETAATDSYWYVFHLYI